MQASTRKNLGFAALAGGIFALTPFSTNGLLASIGAGLVLGGAVFGYREYLRRPGPEEDVGAEAAEPLVVLPEKPALLFVVLGLFVALFLPTMGWMFDQWVSNVWENAHGIFIPVLMFFMARSALRRDTRTEAESSLWGLAFLIPSVVLVTLDSAMRTQYVSALALVVALPGLSLLFLGARRTRMLAAPLAMGFFMVPLPNAVATHLFLKKATAIGVEPLIRALGIPVLRTNTILSLPDNTFLVGDACSGFATLYAALALALILARYSGTWWRRGLILVSVLPLAMACNIVRVLILVLMAHFVSGDLLDTALHEASGVFTFWGVLGLLFMISDREALREAFA